jgi:predicted nuclease of restriction endonuclease-like RecB superfamily
MRKKYKVKIEVSTILDGIRTAEEYIASDDPDKQEIGESLKSLFQKLLARKQKELREAIEKSAKAKKTKFWRE